MPPTSRWGGKRSSLSQRPTRRRYSRPLGRSQRHTRRAESGSALVNDDVVVTRFGVRWVFVGVGSIGGKGDRVSGAKLEHFTVDVHLQLSCQDDEHFVGPCRVGLGGVGGSRRKPELVGLHDG